MARQVLPIVGAVIGAYFGGPQGAQIGYAIGSLVGNAVDPLIVDGPKIGDVAQQTSSEGVYQPIYFGTAQGAGNIIAQGPNIIRKRKTQQGKGGGPVTVTESLYKTFAIRIGVSWKGEEGIVGVSRIWENGKLVYDVRPESSIPEESAQFSTKFRLYLGTDDQSPDPDLEAIYGIGNTPSYRGRAYIVFPLYNITEWRAIPQYSFEVVTGGSASPPIQVVAMRGTSELGAQDWLFSPDGNDFSGDWQSSDVLYGRNEWLITSPEMYVSYSRDNIPAILQVGESDWVVAVGDQTTGTGGEKYAAIDYTGQVIVIPQNGDSYLRSLDSGASWQLITGAFLSIDSCAYMAGSFIGINKDSDIYSSLNNGSSWSPITNLFSEFRRSDGGYRFYGPWKVVWGGHSASFPRVPAVAETTSGIFSWAVTELPGGSDGTHVSCGASSQEESLADTYTYIACANDGKIWRKVGEIAGWDKIDFEFSFEPKDATHNGNNFYVIGDTGGEDRQGFIMSSPDGENWSVERNEVIPSSETWNLIQALPVSGGEVNSEPPHLGECIETIHSWVGQSVAEFDKSELDNILVRGWILAGGYSAKDCINSMQGLWQFDSPEYDKKIHYRLRGQDIVRIFTFDDLIDEPEESTREQAIEYPKKANLDYQSPAVDYAPAKATSSRSSIDTRVVGEANIQVPVVLTPDEAAQRVTVFHKVFWADADGEVIFSISDENLDLVPGDCIGLSLRGTIRRLRIVQMEIAAGVLKLTCRNDRQSAYTSNVTGIEPPPPTPPPPSIVGPTMLIVGDWPALRDQDDVSTFVKYIAMGGISEAWRGALGEVSTDLGNTYSDMLDVTQGAVMGTLQDDITDAAPYFSDHTNVLLIQLDMTDGSIEIDSLTEAQFLGEQGGIALVKADGNFEIMQYRDANDLGDGLYELSYLQRGRLDSTTQSFSIGDRFVLLDSIAVVTAPVSHLGLDIYHRATSYGNTTESGTVVHDVFEGNSQKEWPVAHLFLEVSGDTINGTIVPRHRFGTDANPIRSINWTGYEIQFQDATDQIDTVTQTSDVFSYDASSMTFPVTVTVSQINRLTGAGPSLSEVTP